MLAGNTGNRRKTMFVPNGVNSVNTKEGMLKDQYDEWLAKVVCYTFSVSPQHFLSSMNRATAQVAADNSKEEGLEPIKAWLKNLIDYIIWKYFGYKDLELEYVDNKDPDLLQQAQIDDIYLKNGVYGVNEVRAKLGLDALSDEELAAAAPQPEPDPNNPDDGDDNDPAPDDTMKMDIAGKKSFRVLTPINRQRTSVTKQEKKLTDLLTKLFDDEKDRIAKQVVDGYSNIGKADDDHAPVDSVLAEITAAAAADKILSDVTIDWSESAESISAIIKSISTDGVVEAAVQLGWDEQSALDLANTNAEKWAAERGAELVGMKWVDGELVTNPNPYWAITDSTRNRLKSTIVDAIKLGSTNNELAANIVDNYAFSTDRAIMIARTETAFADVEGNMLMYKEVKDTGVVILKKWITGAGECDRCNLNGQHDPIDLNGIFPSGAKQPPDHPNCRCDILPVLEEED